MHHEKTLRNNGLTIVVMALCLLLIVGQTLTGWKSHDDDRKDHQRSELSLGQYLRSGHFAEAIFENWESEFLQMGAYVVLTAFLFQKGSAESKDPDKKEKVDEEPEKHRDGPDAPRSVKSGGTRLKIYKHSLALSLFGLFALTFIGHAIGGAKEYSEEQQAHGGDAVSTLEFLQTSEFRFQSFQNWQSEFLAVGALTILSIWLREEGSPESKPVHAPHTDTGAG